MRKYSHESYTQARLLDVQKAFVKVRAKFTRLWTEYKQEVIRNHKKVIPQKKREVFNNIADFFILVYTDNLLVFRSDSGLITESFVAYLLNSVSINLSLSVQDRAELAMIVLDRLQQLDPEITMPVEFFQMVIATEATIMKNRRQQSWLNGTRLH